MDPLLRLRSSPPLPLQLRPGRLKLRLGHRGRRLRGSPNLSVQPGGGGGGAALKVGRRSALRLPPAEDLGELGLVGVAVFAASAPSVPSHLCQEQRGGSARVVPEWLRRAPTRAEFSRWAARELCLVVRVYFATMQGIGGPWLCF